MLEFFLQAKRVEVSVINDVIYVLRTSRQYCQAHLEITLTSSHQEVNFMQGVTQKLTDHFLIQFTVMNSPATTLSWSHIYVLMTINEIRESAAHFSTFSLWHVLFLKKELKLISVLISL